MVTWPDEVEGQSSEVKGQWIKHLLEKAAGLCASFLKRGEGLMAIRIPYKGLSVFQDTELSCTVPAVYML